MFKQRGVRRKEAPAELGAVEKAFSPVPETASQASTPTAATFEDDEITATDIEEEEAGSAQGVPHEQQQQQRRQPAPGEDDEPLESIIARVPRDEEGRPTSIGSLRHSLGDCRPCAYSGSVQRPCLNSVRCGFCHLPHSPKRRIRLCRRKRMEMRAAVEAAVAGAGAEGVTRPPRHVPISW